MPIAFHRMTKKGGDYMMKPDRDDRCNEYKRMKNQAKGSANSITKEINVNKWLQNS